MKSKIFHISTPFEQPNTGDYDYGTALVKALNDVGQLAEYVTTATTTAGYVLAPVAQSVKAVNNKRNDPVAFQAAYTSLKGDPNRKVTIAQIKAYILQTAETEGVTPILNLQLRAPETGFAFMPEDLEDFKKAGIKVNVTCHEYKLNNTRRQLQSVLHKYFEAADSVTFFNSKDRDSACKHADHRAFADTTKFPPGDVKAVAEVALFTAPPYDLRSKTLLTRVPPTVSYARSTFEEFQARPPNVIAFGIIREGKGFEEAIDIAKVMKRREHEHPVDNPPRMIIVGAPDSTKILAEILCAKFDDQSIKTIISEHNGETQYIGQEDVVAIAERHRNTSLIHALSKDSIFRIFVDNISPSLDEDIKKNVVAMQSIYKAIATKLVDRDINQEVVNTAISGAANNIQIFGTSGTTAVGAIGTITIGTGVITPGTACTIDTTANATIAANVIEAAADQIRQVLRKVDNASSALEGVSDTQIGIEEAMGSAVEELTAADITECMSEIVKGQSMVQYTTAVWSGQKQLSDLALRTFQEAVA